VCQFWCLLWLYLQTSSHSENDLPCVLNYHNNTSPSQFGSGVGVGMGTCVGASMGSGVGMGVSLGII
jgi:hypothetical protein